MNIHVQTGTDIQMWFTAQELATSSRDGTIPGLPGSVQGINDLARRENWQRYHALVQTKTGRGGAITRYHIELLPLHIRTTYLARFIKAEPADCARPVGEWVNLTDRARLERDARLAIIRIADRFRQNTGLNAIGSDAIFSDAYNSARVDLPDWVRETVKKVSARSIMRWRAQEKEGGEALGHDPSQARKGTGLLDTANEGAIRNNILAWVTTAPQVSAEEIREYVEDEFGDELVDPNGELKPLPSLRMFQHFIKGLKASQKVVMTAINDPDRYRSHYRLRGTGSYSWITKANQLWMIDASPGDALLLDGRHSIYVCVDVATRWLTITVAKTPRASAVGLLMRKAILQSGTCKMVKTDNGSDFVAVETQRLFHNIGTEAVRSEAFTPEDKALVERAIKTVQHKFFTGLKGYIGHNVAERKAIEDRKSFSKRLGATAIETFEASVTAAELQVMLDDWLEHKYHQRKHGGLFGRTPAQARAEYTDVIRRIDVRALDMLLMPAPDKNGIRKMTAQGVSVDSHYYMCGSLLPGTEVFVRLNPDDMGKIHLYDPETGQFLGDATCAALSDINRVAFMKTEKAEGRAMMADLIKPVKKEIRRIQKGPSGIERTIRLAKKKTAEREASISNVIALPKREVQHSTPAIAAALDAATAPRTPQPKSLNEAAARLHEALVREAENKGKSKVIHLDPDASLSEVARKYKWAIALEARIAAGQPLDDTTAVQLVRFQGTAEYQTIKDCHRAFGLENALTMN